MNNKNILIKIQELNEYVNETYDQLDRYIITNNNKFLYICMDNMEEISTILADLEIEFEGINYE